MSEKKKERKICPKHIIKKVFVGVTAVLWVGMAVFLLGLLFRPGENAAVSKVETDITADFEYMLTKKMSDIVEIDSGDVSFSSTKRRFTLNDQDMVAPEPNPACYGAKETAKEMETVLQEARDLLDVQDTLFNTEIEIMKNTKVQYYLDDTIFAVTWKQGVGGSTYTFSEVKIAHASQFRRFLADGKYRASASYTTQEMAGSVNAVVASAGDYYGHRGTGVCVYQGVVYREDARRLDTCFIDENGDLLFARRGEFADEGSVQKYVEENNVRFSLSFGPVMIENGENVLPRSYHVGEIYGAFSRAALCQMGPLHYVVVTCNYERPYNAVHTMFRFTENLMDLGITKAYALDGGQTATIVMNDQVINKVNYGAQRRISDIIYFATAFPEDEWE